jgi:hypothetical protein
MRHIMDSAKSHLAATRGRPYLLPHTEKCRHTRSEAAEEMPTDEEGIKARSMRMKCQVLSSKLKPETKVFRSSKEAWELALKNLPSVKSAMKRKGMLGSGHRYKDAFFCLGIDAAYFAALTWDSEKISFRSHLFGYIKRCWRPMFETMAFVPFSSQRAINAKSYWGWKAGNPDGGPREYAECNGIGLDEALSHEKDCSFRYGTTNPISGHILFNGIPGKSKIPPRYRDVLLFWSNPLDLEGQLDKRDRAKAELRISEILGEVLNPKEQKVMQLRFVEGKTLEEIGNMPMWRGGTSTKQNVKQVEAKAILKLRSSRFAGELREYYENLG